LPEAAPGNSVTGGDGVAEGPTGVLVGAGGGAPPEGIGTVPFPLGTGTPEGAV